MPSNNNKFLCIEIQGLERVGHRSAFEPGFILLDVDWRIE